MQTNQVLLKQMTIEYIGDNEQYESFKKLIEASPHLYSHDFSIYNDSVSSRHQRYLREISYLKKLLKEKKLTPNMLSHNTVNTFYPSYILHHHYFTFLKILQNHFPGDLVQTIQTKYPWEHFLGAYLYQTKSTNLKSSVSNHFPNINSNGQLQMHTDTYFYSLNSNPYLSHALILAKKNDQTLLALVNIRDQEGKLCQGVNYFDFGATISPDYITVGLNFNKVKPLATFQITAKEIRSVRNYTFQPRYGQFNYSLKDLQKSLWITTQYTSMRRQFKTIPDNKQERPIITYQAISTRLVEGFALLIAFSDLNCRLLKNSQHFLPIYSELLQSSHHMILQTLVSLRQCCGGFGYLQVSGHPGCIQRVCNRAGNDSSTKLDLGKNFLKATQFYVSNEQLSKFFTQQIKQLKINYQQLFGLFLTICQNMRKSHQENSKEYKRQFLRQCTIMAMHSREDFLRYQGTNIHCLLLQYFVYSYINRNSRLLNWQLVKIEKEVFLTELNKRINELLSLLTKNIVVLGKTLQLDYLRNVVVGRHSQEDFYAQLVKRSKQNLRNSKQFIKYVREPIVEMIATNNASL